MTDSELADVAIIGAGPAALSAAIYTTREDLKTVLYEKAVPGGLIATTDWVDNYPGFPKGIAGLELGDNMRQQAERFGAQIEFGEVLSIKTDGDKRVLVTTDGEVKAKTVLIATGCQYKKLGIPGEDALYGRGVHYCATCDGAFYRDKTLVVVGGGNSAVQEAMFLTRFATKIDMLVRGDKLKASDVLQEELLNKHKDKVTIHFNTTTDEFLVADNKLAGVVGTDKTTGKKVNYKPDGVFVFVGLEPTTGFAKASGIELDERGFIKSDENLVTSMPGVFVAGDCRAGATMQIATAVGEGATAALKIREYLEHKKLGITTLY